MSRLAVALVAAFAVVGGGVAQALTHSPQFPVVDGAAAHFTAGDTLGCQTDGISCEWTFSDGGTAPAGNNAAHQYTSFGTGTETVTVTADDGNPLTLFDPFETEDVTLNQAPPDVPTVSGPGVVQLGNAATFTASTSEGSSFSWFVDGALQADTGASIAPVLSAGRHTISASATDNQGAASADAGSASVFVNQPPIASFTVSPLSPIAGQTVTFISTSTDPDPGDTLTTIWDLDGNNVFTDAFGAKASTVYTTSGSRTVRLQVTDANGGSGTAFSSVDVAPKKTKSGPKLLSPFPRVRYAGRLTPRGVFITLLAVRMPKGARFKATCAKRCPAKAVTAKARKTGDRILRKLRGTYRSGAVLRISITKSGRIGKYTQISIPSGGAPRRLDKCLWPSSKKPRKCP
jgi:PKD repeat protein